MSITLQLNYRKLCGDFLEAEENDYECVSWLILSVLDEIPGNANIKNPVDEVYIPWYDIPDGK